MTFRALTLAEAEEQLVGRCITDRRLLELCLERIGPMRACEPNVQRVYRVLSGLADRGFYDPENNEDLLIAAGTKSGLESCAYWEGLMDTLWCPWMAVPEYAEALVDAVVTAHEYEDAEAEAIRRNRFDNPFVFRPAPPSPVARDSFRVPPKRGGYVGGITL